MTAVQSAHPLPPGATIGILGGGQLGRMLAMAAARLGFKCHIYSDSRGPAFDVASTTTLNSFTDPGAIRGFARAVDVVTYEFENVPVASALAAAEIVPVRPGAKALEVAQDRFTEKSFLSGLGIPVAPFMAVDDLAGLRAAMTAMDAPAILKTRRLGYDGKGQIGLAPGDDLKTAWAAIGAVPAVLEKRLTFTLECSVLLVRSLTGATGVYDVTRNEHRDGILHTSTVPSGLPGRYINEARAIARKAAEALDYTGLLAVEMFWCEPAAGLCLVVNEIAPRVHNSGHWTIDACAVSQFENHIRAVAGWPLGPVARHSDAVMTNLIGADHDRWPELAAEPSVALHLYGKHEARRGRKMGHVTRLKPLSAE